MQVRLGFQTEGDLEVTVFQLIFKKHIFRRRSVDVQALTPLC